MYLSFSKEIKFWWTNIWEFDSLHWKVAFWTDLLLTEFARNETGNDFMLCFLLT